MQFDEHVLQLAPLRAKRAEKKGKGFSYEPLPQNLVMGSVFDKGIHVLEKEKESGIKRD